MPKLYPKPLLCHNEPVSWRNGCLYIDGAFQLSEQSSHIYHECLVSLPLCFVSEPKNVLILGGGDGCSAYEALKFPSVDQVVVVDYNPMMTRLASEHAKLLELNHNSFADPKVVVIHTDATDFVEKEPDNFWDCIILDFTATDGNASIDSALFHQGVERILKQDGVWSRVMDFPWFVAARWSYKTPTRYFDVEYPGNGMGETFLTAVRQTNPAAKNTNVMHKMRYLSVNKLAAFSSLPVLSPKEAYSRALL